jgi:hypothetical protein
MESVNLAHLHLLLNHLPTVGFGVGVVIYIIAYFAKNDVLRKAALVVFFLIAVMAIPTYASGNAAESVLCPELKCPEDISVETVRAHEDAAFFGFVLMEITGFFSWLALWQIRRTPKVGAWNWNVILLFCCASFIAMALAAAEGGEIRHPEIRAKESAAAGAAEQGAPEQSAAVEPGAVEPGAATQPAAAAEQDAATAGAPEQSATEEGATEEGATEEGERYQGITRAIGAVVAGHTGIGWIWPACEALHFVGLCMIFAVVLALDLRILGMAKGLSFQALYQLMPFGMLGFALNLVTGMLFFVATPGQYITNPEFHRKVIFIILAGINVLYFMIVDETWVVGPGDEAPPRAKFAAASAIFIWLAVLYYGHMLPFLGNAF